MDIHELAKIAFWGKKKNAIVYYLLFFITFAQFS